jgi:alkylation response protein AidB-like acyl-CoA dehydrogenase
MYSFEPNEEQQMLMDAVGKYAANDLRPAAHDAEESHELPKKLVSKGWELGLLQASTPESYGGFGDRSARSLACWLSKRWRLAISQARWLS